MSLDDLEKRLYAEQEKGTRPRAAPRPRGEMERGTPAVLEEWQREEMGEKRRHPFFWWMLAAVGVLLFLAVGAVVLILSSGGGGEGITLTLYAPSEIYRGVPFELKVEVENQLDEIIRDATLSLNLPAGLVSVDNIGTNRAITSESIGDIGGRTVAKKTFRLLAVGLPDSLQKANVTLSYGTGGRSRFQASAEKEIIVNRAAVKLAVTKPERVISGSAFELEVGYENASRFDFSDVTLRMKYPDGFSFQSASANPDSLDSSWRLGALNAGSKGVLRVKGVLTGVGEAQFSLPVTVIANFGGEEYLLAEENVALALAPAPVNLQVLVNGRSDYVARAGDMLTYTVSYRNESGIALADVVLKLSLSGELFNFTTLDTDARIDSLANTLTWNAGNTPPFRLLDPGASGEVRATVRLKPSFPIRRPSDKNFFLRVQAEASSPSVPYYLSADKTTALASMETKVAGLTVVYAQAFFRDVAAGMLNQGKLPPQVGQPTEYTIHWVIRNYGTDVKNVAVSAFLQSGVTWTGLVKSSIDAVPLWNERRSEVTWQIEKIAATKGVISDPIEAVFQVRATPDVTEVGQYQPLMGETTLRTTDDFTGLELTSRDAGFTTALPDDRTVGEGIGRVIP
ncbi:hypothetical protein COX26_01450 [Candidatus Jorgensenbacteria bacterium CG23_combo_of_CG06-09_8_20_14_all_54_14]|uniref:DUF11 domain-containing protein n=1 Tax=Candidatus Jorgensenbacteria bacterium CG23_combo_of_CG06-09_8_20_14_all_54_14 TaxID=1974595 RepID=A0A2G9Z9V4_9BACT|nr:MAG: hypothetical protein COX26_01450 [Candidatus Jorgensenbacteria bacterium CG23_combo_of_CG06-09_8_20_14_all_54_14]